MTHVRTTPKTHVVRKGLIMLTTPDVTAMPQLAMGPPVTMLTTPDVTTMAHTTTRLTSQTMPLSPAVPHTRHMSPSDNAYTGEGTSLSMSKAIILNEHMPCSC